MKVFELKLGLQPNSGFSCSLNEYLERKHHEVDAICNFLISELDDDVLGKPSIPRSMQFAYFCLSMVGNGLFWSSILREILVGVAPPLSMMMSSDEGRAPLPSPPSLRLKVRYWLCDERWSPRNFSGAMKYPVSCTDCSVMAFSKGAGCASISGTPYSTVFQSSGPRLKSLVIVLWK